MGNYCHFSRLSRELCAVFGICPGNRLKIISYEATCYKPSPVSSPCPSIPSIYYNNSILSSADSILYENTVDFGATTSPNHQKLQGKRRSWHIMPNKVVTPQKCGDVYLYDLLPKTPNRLSSPYQNLSTMSDSETYDTPRPTQSMNYDSPRPWSRTSQLSGRLEESYDVPRSVSMLSQNMLGVTPSSSNSSLLLTPDSHSMSSSNRSSLANMPDYDIPRRFPGAIRPGSSLTPTSSLHFQSTYDIPVSNQPKVVAIKELPLELSSALETLAKLESEATGAINKLLGFVSPHWRTKEKLEPMIMDIKLAAVRLRTVLHDLAEFGEGALGNASKADDKRLAVKLRPLVKALRDADKLVHEVLQNIDLHGWTLETLAKEDPKHNKPGDNLNQLIACAQTLTEDVRQITSFIQGNATLLFKRSLTQTNGSSNNNNNNNNNGGNQAEWLEDYDYVSLESKEQSAKTNAELRDALPQDLRTNFDTAMQSAESAAISNSDKTELNPNDKSLLTYYASQTVTHMKYLTQAIDAFLQTVERNQPPKFFLAYGKFVVLSAHNLVAIGDIVHRNLSKQDVKRRVLEYADSLSDALKTCVTKTKKAAQHFPSVTAVQEMVDSIVDISHLAYNLKISMLQAISQ
ncbi:breast cancer anti-estrogen resistance protein 1 isoform X2 [Sitodiplosis mosellana]|uniref:breast cancer anti-estrogen resistance protein 1 isoform X2 n=1 Tax=Sitodiplosis mosellana TaxID=263140 RepID=UPI0024451C58|nr:breast cancer anti-estrogen resistance protein 1 isoform X2 [Sitodiplosis mosellana]